MNDFKLIRRIRLGSAHRSTGRTRHYRGLEELPRPSELRIVQYEGDSGFYLLYCDGMAREFTDTYHENIERAMSQAEWEFSVKPDEWETGG